MRYLTAQELLVLHALVIDETGGSHGVRDVGLLQSIVQKPAASFGGADLYKGIFVKASVFLEAIVNYHVFVDGNKRTGLVAAARFLSMNGYTFAASNTETEKMILAVATKEVDVTILTAWLKKYSKKSKG